MVIARGPTPPVVTKQNATRGHLLEADIDLHPLQQPRAQVSLSYVPSPAGLYLVSTYFIKPFSQQCA